MQRGSHRENRDTKVLKSTRALGGIAEEKEEKRGGKNERGSKRAEK